MSGLLTFVFASFRHENKSEFKNEKNTETTSASDEPPPVDHLAASGRPRTVSGRDRGTAVVAGVSGCAREEKFSSKTQISSDTFNAESGVLLSTFDSGMRLPRPGAPYTGPASDLWRVD